MQPWDESSDQVSRISPDKERARSLLQVVALREKDVSSKDPILASLIIEDYYEIIKELITAILFIDGFKTTSHELLIGYLKRFYKQFSSSEIYLADQLRIIRNDLVYRGIIVPPGYLPRNKDNILIVIAKLKTVVGQKLGGKT